MKHAPNFIEMFFKYHPDHDIEKINEKMENVIEDLSNTKDAIILSEINNYPILAVKAHTRPFERRWLNEVAAIIVPAGIFFYSRMWRFRLRLLRDLKIIKETNEHITKRILEM